MPFDNLVYTRDQWKEKRDKANPKVPKGATKVSVGDALDKFHKEAAKGPEKGLAEARKLQKVVADYRKGLDKKYEDFAKKSLKTLELNIKNYIEYYEKIPEQMNKYTNALKIAHRAFDALKKDYEAWVKTKNQRPADEVFKHPNWEPLGEALLSAGNTALALALEDDKYTEIGKELRQRGLDIDGKKPFDRTYQGVATALSKYKP